ncbi:MAG: macro domain-containing protein [Thermoplasmata archaeon]|nr:macro domain-containing protein [Thermoplasmata archaeon]
MKFQVGKSIFEIVEGDITRQDCEAVVNAANPRLSPGGGVSGAIHRAAGRQLWEEAKKLGGCKTGEAKITKGYKLAKYVIHTVGPVYRGSKEDRELLENCYINSLKIAFEHKIKSIAFPAISTGIYGYPMEEAAEVAIKAIINFLKNCDCEMNVKLVLYGNEAYKIHEKFLERFMAKANKQNFK